LAFAFLRSASTTTNDGSQPTPEPTIDLSMLTESSTPNSALEPTPEPDASSRLAPNPALDDVPASLAIGGQRVAIPPHTTAEKRGLGPLVHLMRLEEAYKQKKGKYGDFEDLAELTPNLLDVKYSAYVFDRRGYLFTLLKGDSDYTITAMPADVDLTDAHVFEGRSDGTIIAKKYGD
jgi:hypothetical protein